MPLLSVPIGATWKYLTGVGRDYDGFGLDSAPSGADADPAQPGYDDSEWAVGVTQFHNDTWDTDGDPSTIGPVGTVYAGGKIWARKQVVTHGGDLLISGVVDNTGWFYLDGEALSGRSSLGGIDFHASDFIGHAPAAGIHTFAFFTTGDGIYDQAGWSIVEEAPPIDPTTLDLSVALSATTRSTASLRPAIPTVEVP